MNLENINEDKICVNKTFPKVLKNPKDNKVIKKIIKETEEKDNLKYVKVINKDENGKVISKEEKDYPEAGNYEMHFIYGNEVATIKVIVKDTTKPEIKAPTSIDIFQYTYLPVRLLPVQYIPISITAIEIPRITPDTKSLTSVPPIVCDTA